MTANALCGGTYLNCGPERIIYGSYAGEAVLTEVARLGVRRVFVTSSASLAALAIDGKGPLAEVQGALGGLFAGAFASIRSHAPREDVVAAAREARKARADLIVAIGGGSVIDATKAVLLCAWHDVNDGSSMEQFRLGTPDQRPIVPPAQPLRIIAVSTTLSAAELTAGAGITEPTLRVKQSFRHPLFVPRTAVLDPCATVFTPLSLLLSTGMRAVDHAVESYCSLQAHPMSELHAVTGLRMLMQALPLIADNPLAMPPRQDAQLGMWQATLGATSGAGTGASHGIGYALGAAFGVPHGVTSCVMLPAVLRYNASVNRNRQQALAAAIGRPGEELADLINQMVLRLGLPSTLHEAGIARHQWSELAQRALTYEPVKRNPRTIRNEEDVMEILALAA